MKRLSKLLRVILKLLSLFLLGGLSAHAASGQVSTDYQRYITFYNDFDFTVFPVIQVPQETCDHGNNGDRRIIVNGPGHNGIYSGEKLTVLIPDTSVVSGNQTYRCWYRSGRIYIFPLDVMAFESQMKQLNSAISNQATVLDSGSTTCYSGDYQQGYNPPSGGANVGKCYTGTSGASYALDAPAQLAEYTFDSDNADSQNDPDSGIPMADIDVSSVDDLYLPVAASVSNHGATGYMGSAMKLTDPNKTTTGFKSRVSAFVNTVSNPTANTLQWPIFGAFASANWTTNAFYTLMPAELGSPNGDGIQSHIPGGYNTLVNTLSRPIPPSPLYGDHTTSYLISGMGSDLTQDPPNNPIVQQYVDRFMLWVNLNHDWINNEPGDPCGSVNIASLIWPQAFTNKTSSAEKLNFCQKFRDNAQYLWDYFYKDYGANSSKYLKDCGLSKLDPNIIASDPNIRNACIYQHIVGYNSDVMVGQLPGRVQALMRSVAYDPRDGLNQAIHQYQFDPFLTFSAPYNSQFSVNPYTRLIHSPTDGVGAVAYSFSIDDKYGNFRDASNGFVVDAGGVTALINQRPYDPYQQYRIAWGFNRDQFILAKLPDGADLGAIQSNLETISSQYSNCANCPLLLLVGNDVSVLGHAPPSKGGGWILTNPPLTSFADLTNKANQEKINQQGKANPTHNYQDLINRIWGLNGVTSIYPVPYLDVNNVNNNALAVLNFDTVDPSWAGGAADLYGLISQQNADYPNQNNWQTLKLWCPDPNNPLTIPINGPGSQSIPFFFANNQYNKCQMQLQDSWNVYTLALNTGPVKPSPTPIDNYTGSPVNGVLWGLPIGNNFSSTPPITSNLSAADMQYCQNNSSAAFVSPSIAGCNNVNVSATWSADPLSRDTVYMGLDPKKMPRITISVIPPPNTKPDEELPYWPQNMVVNATSNGKTILVNWTKAIVGDPQVKLRYGLTLKTLSGTIITNVLCDPTFPGGYTTATQCSFPVPANVTYPIELVLIAINMTTNPWKQTGNFCVQFSLPGKTNLPQCKP